MILSRWFLYSYSYLRKAQALQPNFNKILPINLVRIILQVKFSAVSYFMHTLRILYVSNELFDGVVCFTRFICRMQLFKVVIVKILYLFLTFFIVHFL